MAQSLDDAIAKLEAACEMLAAAGATLREENGAMAARVEEIAGLGDDAASAFDGMETAVSEVMPWLAEHDPRPSLETLTAAAGTVEQRVAEGSSHAEEWAKDIEALFDRASDELQDADGRVPAALEDLGAALAAGLTSVREAEASVETTFAELAKAVETTAAETEAFTARMRAAVDGTIRSLDEDSEDVRAGATEWVEAWAEAPADLEAAVAPIVERSATGYGDWTAEAEDRGRRGGEELDALGTRVAAFLSDDLPERFVDLAERLHGQTLLAATRALQAAGEALAAAAETSATFVPLTPELATVKAVIPRIRELLDEMGS